MSSEMFCHSTQSGGGILTILTTVINYVLDNIPLCMSAPLQLNTNYLQVLKNIPEFPAPT